MAQALTFTVTSTSDLGTGTLRNAINSANTTPGADTIAFNISGTGVHTITPMTGLPMITEAVTIDGYSQPGSSANTLTNGDNELNGAGAGGTAKALVITAGNCTVRGLVINRFASSAGECSNNGGNVITGNFIGTDAIGTSALGNGFGVIFNSGSNNTVGGTTPAARNVVSGNLGTGVGSLDTNSTGNLVQGNFVGVDASGTVAIGNGDSSVGHNDVGVFVKGSSSLIGGRTAAARNIISGNSRGVQLEGTGHFLQGNFIGTDVTGTAALPNQDDGVTVNGARNLIIGGVTNTPGTPPGNLISGNFGVGLDLLAGEPEFNGSNNNQIQGNIIGADATRTASLANSLFGISIVGIGNTVGGTTAGTGNIIAFNGSTYGDGVFISAPVSTIRFSVTRFSATSTSASIWKVTTKSLCQL
jgi:hypothetical protein